MGKACDIDGRTLPYFQRLDKNVMTLESISPTLIHYADGYFDLSCQISPCDLLNLVNLKAHAH